VELFPDNSLSDVLRGYFLFHNKRILEDEDKKANADTSEEGLDRILASIITSNDTLAREGLTMCSSELPFIIF
jgi:superkiller protein 3